MVLVPMPSASARGMVWAVRLAICSVLCRMVFVPSCLVVLARILHGVSVAMSTERLCWGTSRVNVTVSTRVILPRGVHVCVTGRRIAVRILTRPLSLRAIAQTFQT